MKILLRHIGLVCILLGCLLLAVSLMAGWTRVNAVQFVALALILAGVFLHVRRAKRQSRY